VALNTYPRPTRDIIDVMGGASLLAEDLNLIEPGKWDRSRIQMWRARDRRIPDSVKSILRQAVYARIARAFERKGKPA